MRGPNRLLVVLSFVLAAACAGGHAAPDFTLRDDDGAAWTRSQQGKAMVLLFGFTHCMDTCPATLAKLERATQGLGVRARDLDVVFVTIDPQRDSPAVLKRYLANFARPGASTLVGLTGTQADVASVQRAYHVWSQKLPDKHGMGYDEAHTSVIFLIDARGRMRGMQDDDASPQSLAQALRGILD